MCVFIDLSSSLLITGSSVPHSGLLNDITVEYVERLQVRHALSYIAMYTHQSIDTCK